MKAILGKKVGMTQIFNSDGTISPVTVIEAGPCVVAQVKTKEKDGYAAVQIGFGKTKEKKLTKPERGHFAKVKVTPTKHLAEVRVGSNEEYQIGQEIKVDVFAVGDKADVSGISIGKGFAGSIKRWRFHGGPASHGSHAHRIPGSIGASATPSRVFKGKKLPGHLGSEKVTVQNLEVAKIIPEQNLLLLKGSIPGASGGLVMIRSSVKSPGLRKTKRSKGA